MTRGIVLLALAVGFLSACTSATSSVPTSTSSDVVIINGTRVPRADVGGLATPSVPADQVSMEDAVRSTRWKLAIADGRAWPVHEKDVTLEFLDRRLGGWNGCNSYGANWTMEARRLHVGPVQSTSMGCQDDATARVQHLLWVVLRSSPMLTLRNQELRLRSPDGVLVFSEA